MKYMFAKIVIKFLQSDMEAAREAYDAFLSHYPYCYGYWRKYADYEKRKGNKKKCEEVSMVKKVEMRGMLKTYTIILQFLQLGVRGAAEKRYSSDYLIYYYCKFIFLYVLFKLYINTLNLFIISITYILKFNMNIYEKCRVML